MTALATRQRQSLRWSRRAPVRTVFLVEEDTRTAFKRAFASTLLGLRAERSGGSQKDMALSVGTSEATYARWEKLTDPAMPDAFELSKLIECLQIEDPNELLAPTELSPRERELARRLARGSKRGRDQAPGA